MSSSDWIALVATLAATLATAFAAMELRSSWRERRDTRTAYRDGVAVAWHPLERPNHPARSGDAVWVYEITAQNPGPLPIRDVVVTLTFGPEVRRRHYDGAADAPSHTVTMRQPVILGQGTRTWKRSVVLSFEERDLLEATTASITFTSADAPRQTNHMNGRAPTIEQPA